VFIKASTVVYREKDDHAHLHKPQPERQTIKLLFKFEVSDCLKMGAAESTTREGSKPRIVHDDFDSLNFYEILGISEDATADEVKHAWRQRAREHHPDKNLDDALGAGKRFGQVQEAYETLIDGTKRREYEYTRKRSSSATSTPAPAPTPSHENDSWKVPGGFGPTQDQPSPGGWYEWLFGRSTGHRTQAQSKFEYQTYSSRRSPGPGISSLDIAEFVHSIGNPKWYTRDNQGVFSIFQNFFACLAHDEWLLSGVKCPSFGCAHSFWTRQGWDEQELREIGVHGPEVREFYKFWTKFETKKSFEWIKRYDSAPGELNARSERFVRKENKIVQTRFREEYNELVQLLAQALQESDPRYQLHVVLQAERCGKAQSSQNKNHKKNGKKKRNKKRR